MFITIAITGAALAHAETITDSARGFTLDLPDGFVPRRDLVAANPGIVQAFEMRSANQRQGAVLLLIEKLRGTIGREPMRPQDFPPGFIGNLFTTTWQGFEVDGTEVPEEANGTKMITFNVQIPLKRAAVQVKLFGPVARKGELTQLLRTVLDGLHGESNWLASAAPGALATSGTYWTVLFGIAIVGVLAGGIILWLISRRTPKGIVLAVAGGIYAASWVIGGSSVRETLIISGSMRMLGVVGVILGIVDLCRKRKVD